MVNTEHRHKAFSLVQRVQSLCLSGRIGRLTPSPPRGSCQSWGREDCGAVSEAGRVAAAEGVRRHLYRLNNCKLRRLPIDASKVTLLSLRQVREEGGGVFYKNI